MTDVPSTFFVLLATYALTRAVLDDSAYRGLAWLALAAAGAFLGISVRQSDLALLACVVMVPVLSRREKRFLSVAACIGALAIGGSLYMVHWFAAKPNAYSMHLLPSVFQTIRHPGNAVFRIFALTATLIVFSLPISIVALRGFRRADLKYLALMLAVVAGFLLVTHFWLRTLTLVPYGDVVSVFGILDTETFVGGRPQVIPGRFLILATMISLVSFGFLVRAMMRFREDALTARPFRIWILCQGLFAVVYLAGIILRPATNPQPNDRYLLPILPFFILSSLYLLRLSGPSLLQYATLSLFAAYSIAAVHDYYAQRRICADAADELIHRGLRRTDITAGFAFDSVTEMESSGQVSINGCRNDPGPIRQLNHFLACTPSIRPRFVVGVVPLAGSSQIVIKPESVRLWLPPFKASAYVSIIPPEKLKSPGTLPRVANF